jgi:hypothetical protein
MSDQLLKRINELNKKMSRINRNHRVEMKKLNKIEKNITTIMRKIQAAEYVTMDGPPDGGEDNFKWEGGSLQCSSNGSTGVYNTKITLYFYNQSGEKVHSTSNLNSSGIVYTEINGNLSKVVIPKAYFPSTEPCIVSFDAEIWRGVYYETWNFRSNTYIKGTHA